MIRRILALLVLCASAQAATHYVSSTTGVNSGTGPIGAPWQTLAYAMSNVAAGDTVLLLRGDVWNEALVISQNNLTIDAYGSGPAPRITGYQALTTWTSQGSNVWSAPMASGTSCSPSAGSVLFNEVIGQRQSAQNAVLHDRDFWCNSGTSIYVYAASSPSTYYGRVAAITPSGNGNSLISIAGKTGITIQHLQLDYFDGYGVYVSGTATNLTFANMSVNGILIGENPFVTIAGSRPYGFYVATGTSATTISFVNVDAHLNYDGFRFDSYGAGSQITLTGCRAFANRDVGIFDATTGTPAVTYNYTHLYANGITAIESTDTTGNVIVGSGNRPANEAPVVQGLDRFPALFSFTIDDVGLSAGTETYIDTLTPVFDARGLKMNMAATAGFNPNTTEMAAWATAGHEIDSHSWSHEYYTNVGDSTSSQNMFALQYGPVGTKAAATGTAATMTISGNPLTLSTIVTGGPGGQNLSIDLTTPPNDTLAGLIATIQTNYPNVYTITPKTIRSNAPTHNVTLATVSTPVDIKAAAYTAVRDTTAFWTDEIQKSKQWLEAHVSGLASVPVYVYPGGWNTAASDSLVASSGYVGGRGQIGMHPPGHTTASPVFATDYTATGRGVDVQNIISLTPALWHGLTQAQIDAKVGALVFKARAWGVPFGLFAHNTDLLTPQEVGWILDSILGRHGEIKKNSELVTYLQSGTLVSGTTQYLAPVIGPMPSMRAAGSSPDHAAGPTVGINDAIKSYNVDILGGMRPVPGAWDIGAYPSALWGTQHGSSGTSKTTIYGKYVGVSQENIYCGPGDVPSFGSTDGPASLPQQCTYTAMAGTPSPGTVRMATSCSDIATKLAAVVDNSGDTVVIPASLGTCVGTWAPTYQGDANHWLTIRTDQIANPNFPAQGVQVTPCQIGIAHIDGYPDYPCLSPSVLMPTLSSNTSNGSTLKLSGSSYVRVIGLNITKEATTGMQNSLVTLDGSDHTILDRDLIHSVDWASYDYTHSTKTGVSTKGTHQAIINSWIYDIDYNSADGQAIVGGIGTQSDEGPIKVYNNVIAGSSESWIWGGGPAAAWPHDLEIRRNISLKPLKWMAAIGANTFVGANQAWPNVKNLGEFKHGHRILYEENIFLNVWEGQSDQNGNIIVGLPKSQSRQNTSKYANTSGTSVSCAKDATGTPCDPHTGVWANRITSLARTNGVVTLLGSIDGGWPYQEPKSHAVLQGIPSQTVNLIGGGTLDLNTFNGDVELGCLADRSACTDGYGHPGVAYFASPGADFPQTTLLTTPTQPYYQDYTASTCATPGHCTFSAPQASYPSNPIVSVIDSEHITVAQDLGIQTGVTQTTCHPGANPYAQVQDFTIRYNYLQHAENVGFGLSNAVSNCLDVTKGVSNISYHDNVHDDIDTVAWNRANGSSCCGHGGGGIGVWNSAPNQAGLPNVQAANFTIAHNTFASQRGWPHIGSTTESGSSLGFGDGFDVSYAATTVQRISNVVTLTFPAKSGVNQALQTIITGFTGSYADINGTWSVNLQTGTSISFTETGSHADISPAVTVSSGTTGVAVVAFPTSYYANATWRDNIGAGWSATNWNGGTGAGGTTGKLAMNMCDPSTSTCTWSLKNNVIVTAPYSAADSYGRTFTAPNYTSPFPGKDDSTKNPDGSSTCTITGGCFPANFTGIFTAWNLGVGDTSGNDYTVQAPYKNAGSDGRDIGADIAHWKTVKAAIYPHFTYTALTAASPQTMTCINGTYCEQQLSWSGGASPFVQWHLTSGTLPTGMSFANGDGVNTCKVNGSYSKTGPTGCAGWVWGTPTQTGSFTLTFEVEDAAHQKASVNLTLTVN
jgi:hypothetical protein